ncbi:MAG TPA: polysaccharide deacetylase family protein, partial [Bacteroidia bacterium]|nr:polysaccharide deacetylase family protein [Bacteroidia bacterium]
YGRMRPAQFNAIARKYKVVMWDVLPCDFDAALSNEQVLDLALDYTRPGSIVVLHDSLKAKDKMLWVLPRYIEAMQKSGYAFFRF